MPWPPPSASPVTTTRKSHSCPLHHTHADPSTSTARFNGVLKKLGCKLIKGKVVSLDEAAAASSNGLATPSKPTKAPAKAKTPATGRKRKAKDTTTAAEADDGANAKKKAKLEEENEKGEEDDVKSEAE